MFDHRVREKGGRKVRRRAQGGGADMPKVYKWSLGGAQTAAVLLCFVHRGPRGHHRATPAISIRYIYTLGSLWGDTFGSFGVPFGSRGCKKLVLEVRNLDFLVSSQKEN